MDTKEAYIKQVEKQMESYQNKINKIDDILKNYKSDNKSEILAHRKDLSERFEQAENMLKKIKSSSAEGYEEIKEEAKEIFTHVKDALQEFSSSLSLDRLSRVKEEVVEFGSEKIDEMQELMKKHPITVAAWAISIGFIIGTLFTRSK